MFIQKGISCGIIKKIFNIFTRACKKREHSLNISKIRLCNFFTMNYIISMYNFDFVRKFLLKYRKRDLTATCRNCP